jgi:hypothetical protein
MSVHCAPKLFAAVAKAELSSGYDNYFEVLRPTEPNLVGTVNGSTPLPGVIREQQCSSTLRRRSSWSATVGARLDDDDWTWILRDTLRYLRMIANGPVEVVDRSDRASISIDAELLYALEARDFSASVS